MVTARSDRFGAEGLKRGVGKEEKGRSGVGWGGVGCDGGELSIRQLMAKLKCGNKSDEALVRNVHSSYT